MNMETTLLDRLILNEMTSSRTAFSKKRKLIREAGENTMGGDPNAMGGQDPNAMGGDPNAMGGQDPNAMGRDPNAMGGQDPNAMGGDPNAMGGQDPNAMGGDPNAMGGDPNAMGGQDPNAMGGDPNAMGGQDPMMGDGGDMGAQEDGGADAQPDNDETTLNIDDLTNSQEKMNDKINTIGKNQMKTDDRIAKLLQSVESLQSIIDNNNAEIQRLQKDIIKRNPTPTEDLYLQSLGSYPYNTNIADYWKDYVKTGRDNYNVIAGGAGSKADRGYDIDGDNADEEKVYEITTDDMDDLSADDVYDSFNMNDDNERMHNAFRPRF